LTPQASRAVEAFVGLLRAHSRVTRELNGQLVAEHGLTINDFEALFHLAQAEQCGMRRVDLAERLLLTPSGVTRLLDGLERTGLVGKGSCPSDARVTYAVLTEAGRAKLEQASCSHLAGIGSLLQEHFSPDELTTLAELLGRLGEGEAGAGSA
jgi:DNA-binding MarR family transcriptional regulator